MNLNARHMKLWSLLLLFKASVITAKPHPFFMTERPNVTAAAWNLTAAAAAGSAVEVRGRRFVSTHRSLLFLNEHTTLKDLIDLWRGASLTLELRTLERRDSDCRLILDVMSEPHKHRKIAFILTITCFIRHKCFSLTLMHSELPRLC